MGENINLHTAPTWDRVGNMTTRTGNEYEQHVLKEIRALPASELPKILKMIYFLKEEILLIDISSDEDFEKFWKSFRSWKDERQTEEIIRDLHEICKSAIRDLRPAFSGYLDSGCS